LASQRKQTHFRCANYPSENELLMKLFPNGRVFVLTVAAPVYGLWTSVLKTVHRQKIHNSGDLQYSGHLTIGGQSLQGVFDTGSIELVVLSQGCHRWCGEESRLYNHTVSDSYLTGKYSLVLSYGSGELLGHEAYDTLTVGPFSGKNTSFWEVVDADMPLLFNSNFEAIIGMGPIPDHVINMHPGAPTNNQAYALLLDNLGLKESQYSFCLGQAPGSPGWVTWNDYSAVTTPQLFSQLSVKDSGYWMVKLENLRIGSTMIACAEGCGAVLDTGTSLISMPDDVKDLMEQKVASQVWNCARMQELPDMNFKLDGVEYALPPDAYLARIQGRASQGMEGALDTFKNGTKKQRLGAACEIAVMKVAMTSSLGPTYILGMPFFRSYYTVFAQRKGNKPPHVLTAKADQNCFPMSSDNHDSSLRTTQRGAMARNIDASKVRMPPWLQKASAVGHLEERKVRPTGTRLYASTVIGPHGDLTAFEDMSPGPSVD